MIDLILFILVIFLIFSLIKVRGRLKKLEERKG